MTTTSDTTIVTPPPTTVLAPRLTYVDDLFQPADIARLRTVMVNLYLVGQPGQPDWVLVDAGLPLNGGRIATLANQRFGHAPPQAVVLTHGHFDHVGSLRAVLQRWPGTPVFAHLLELPYLTGMSDYPPPDPVVGGGLMARTSPLLPSGAYDFRPNIRPLPADGSVPFLPEWRWVATPGHSPGHVSFFREHDGALIAGDAFITQHQESLAGALSEHMVMHGPPAYFTTDWGAAKRSVQLLAGLGPKIAFTGHGKPMANPRLAHELNLLAENFDAMAVPADGRYVRRPAIADAQGTLAVPPPLADPRPKVLAGLLLAAGATAWLYTRSRRR